VARDAPVMARWAPERWIVRVRGGVRNLTLGELGMAREQAVTGTGAGPGSDRLSVGL